ncbi:MAG: TonB-dependent receptor [Puniceicoccales bacterium]|nr:TonB-dependent receptor [Puniceicoccales bacterium]
MKLNNSKNDGARRTRSNSNTRRWLHAAAVALALPVAAFAGHSAFAPTVFAADDDANAAAGTASAPSAPAAPVTRLAPVAVIATRIAESPFETAGSTDVVTLDEAQRAGAVTLGETLKYVPGVTVPFSGGVSSGASSYSTGGERGINLRGLEGDRVALLTDGIAQPDEFGAGGGAASTGRIYIDPAVYGQVEIFKTAASSLYGSGALGGAVATETTGPRLLLGSGLKGVFLANTATYASANNSLNNLVQAAAGNGEWAASAVYSARKGHESVTKGADYLNPLDFTSQAVVGKLVREFAKNARLTATVDYYYRGEDVTAKNAAGVMSMGPTMRYEYDPALQTARWERLRFSLAAEVLRATALYDSATITGYWQNAQSRVNSADTTRIVRGTVTQVRERQNSLGHTAEIAGVNSVARKTITTGGVTQTVQYGVEIARGDNSFDFTRYQITDGVGAEQPAAFLMAPSATYKAAVFVSDRIAFGGSGTGDTGTGSGIKGKPFVITPSLRVDYYNVSPQNRAGYAELNNGAAPASFVNWSVAPGLNALWKFAKDANVYALYAGGTRNPTAAELSGTMSHTGTGGMGGADQIRILPNPNLKEETSHNFEVGIQGTPGRHTFRLAAFYNLYDNFIETEYNTGALDADGYNIYTSVNRANTEILGAEAQWHWDIDTRLTGGVDGFQVGAAASWTRGRTDAATGSGRVPLNSVDPWKLVVFAGYTDPANRWGARLTLTVLGKKTAGEIDGTTAPVDAAALLDASAFYRFGDHWTLTAGLNNLTDVNYCTWSTARMASGMSSTRYTQPGINGFVSLTAKF